MGALAKRQNGNRSFFDRLKSFTFTIFGYKVSLEHKDHAVKQERPRSIAMIAPSDHPSIQHVHRSFVEALVDQCANELTFDQYLLKPQKKIATDIATIVDKKYDLIFTFGALCSRLAAEATAAKNLSTPILFSGVQNPESHGLVGPHAPANTTGMAALQKSYAPHVSLLLSVKPHARNVMVAYNSTELWLEDDVAHITQLLAPHNIVVHPVKIDDEASIEKAVLSKIDQVDTLIVLLDNVVAANIETLVEICNAHGVTLFSSDLYMVEKGAAIGLGTLEDTTGRECAQRALLILDKHVMPNKIPVVVPSHAYEVRVNHDTMLQQGLVLSTSAFADTGIGNE